MGKILNNLNEKFSSSGNLISESIKNIDLNMGDGESKPLYPVVKIKRTEGATEISFEFIEGVVPLDDMGVKLIAIDEYESSSGTHTQSSNALLCYKEDEETWSTELSDIFAFNRYKLELSQDKKTVVGINRVRYELQSIFDNEYETQTVSDMWVLDPWWHDYIILYNDSYVETERTQYYKITGAPERWYRDNDRGFYSFRVADGLETPQVTVIYPDKHDPNSYVEFDNGDVLWK